MFNMPADVRNYDWHPNSPFSMDPVEIPTVIICWCCDKPENQCECEDGFDPREDAYCKICAGDCDDCSYEYNGGEA